MIGPEVISGRLIPYWIAVTGTLYVIAFFVIWGQEEWSSVYGEKFVHPVRVSTIDSFGFLSHCNDQIRSHRLVVFFFLVANSIKKMVHKMDSAVTDWAGDLVGFVCPLLVSSCLCTLFLTNHPLPSWRFDLINAVAAALRRHPATLEVADTSSDGSVSESRITSLLSFFWSSLNLPFRRMSEDAKYGHDLASKRVNQFGRGEPNFNVMAFWLAFLPVTYICASWTPVRIQDSDEHAAHDGLDQTKVRVEWVSYLFGWMSTICMIFFLIPVTRHSVLLAAMGWSPIHALRIHIWFGYMAFYYMLIHGLMLVPVYFIYYPYPVYRQIVPHRKCWTWTWTDDNSGDVEPDCFHVYANWTGLLAGVCFTVLWGSSLNWVRRRNYALFYTLHVIFGFFTVVGTLLHMPWITISFIPTFTYYLAATTPTIVQAVASRFRGGVKIRKVVLIEDSGGCVEVHIDAEKNAHDVLNREPCQFIKLCVPRISLIWHPFDVYKSYSVDGAPSETVSFVFRPVGPFTKQLAQQLTSTVERPVTLVDGFYRRSDKVELSMQHDCVTMVAGGVALSPYLSLIPAMLNRIALSERAGEQVKMKSIVLHWACREPGLCRYFVHTYLNTIVMRAKSLGLDTSLTVYVYQTGSNVSVSDDLTDGHDEKTLEAPPATDGSPDETMAVNSDCDGKGSSSGSNEEQDDAKVAKTGERGHPIELARMLPRRHSNPLGNLPFFVYYTGVSLFGFWFLLTRYQNVTWYSYSGLASMTWISIYVVLAFMAFGVLCEACVLGFRKYWPQPFLDEYEIARGEKIVDEKIDEIVVAEDLKKNSEVTIVYREGRPTCDQIFEDARKAAEPGIFMCGPTALTHMVKAEASKENSFLGLTRFCLYDEPYEM